MKRLANSGSFSKIFLGFVLAVYFIDFLMGNMLAARFSIVPTLVLQKYEFWRVLSYPLAASTIESALLCFIAFAVYSTRLEEFLNTKLYPVLLLLIIMLHGILHTIVYWETTVPLAGLEGTAIFIMILMTMLKPAELIRIHRWRNVKASYLTAIIIMLWLFIKTGNTITGGRQHVAEFMSAAVFGLGFGFTTFLQIKIFRNYWKKKSDKALAELKLPKPEEMSMAMATNNRLLRKYYSSIEEEVQREVCVLSDDPAENEERLNEILDKINESGKESLSKLEINFLNEYSKSIQ